MGSSEMFVVRMAYDTIVGYDSTANLRIWRNTTSAILRKTYAKIYICFMRRCSQFFFILCKIKIENIVH